MNLKLKESIAAVILIILAVLFLDPYMLLMLEERTMYVVLALLVVFTLFAGFVWKESARDEREAVHRMASARLAFLVGAGVLTIGIVTESLMRHHVDEWLIVSLVAMVVVKIISTAYQSSNH